MLNKTIYFIFRKSSWVAPKYRIKGCATYNHRDLAELKNPFAFKGNLEMYYQDLKNIIISNLKNKKAYSILRLGDGEAYFLQRKYMGNIQRRHLTSKKTEDLDLNKWRESYLNNDLRTFDLNWSLRKLWKPIEGLIIKRDFFPLNTVYAIVASREVFSISKKIKIGLIGPKSKLDLIQELIKFPQYQNYLGVDKFYNYVYVPQRGACNDVEDLFVKVSNQVGQERCDLYLVGMGIAKMIILSKLKQESNAVFLDIGSGIDAIAGIVPKDRPYFGLWTNYKIQDYDYSKIDMLTQYVGDQYLSKFNLNSDIYLK